MSIFGGASKAEKQQQSDSWQNMNNLFVNSFQNADQLGKKGSSNEDIASNFFQKEMNPTRNDISTNIAPVANQVRAGSDAQKNEQAQMGTARTGGGVAHSQEVQDQTRAMIDNLTGASVAQGKEAGAQGLANVGAWDVNAMLSSLGIASGTEANLSGELHSDIQQKNASAAKMWGALIGGGVKLATAGLFPS